MNYRLLTIKSNEKWCPLPGSLILIKGQKDFSPGHGGNCNPITSSKSGWQWIPESETGSPVLLLWYCNPWCMRILSQTGVYDTHISNLASVLIRAVKHDLELTKKETI